MPPGVGERCASTMWGSRPGPVEMGCDCDETAAGPMQSWTCSKSEVGREDKHGGTTSRFGLEFCDWLPRPYYYPHIGETAPQLVARSPSPALRLDDQGTMRSACFSLSLSTEVSMEKLRHNRLPATDHRREPAMVWSSPCAWGYAARIIVG